MSWPVVFANLVRQDIPMWDKSRSLGVGSSRYPLSMWHGIVRRVSGHMAGYRGLRSPSRRADRDALRLAGIRACLSTPLIARSGRILA
jgi:hypothetical protein